MPHAVDVRGVCVGISVPAGRLDVLRDVTFTIDAGERVAIVGSSGSGKTTLLNVIGGLESEFEGVVMLEGEAVWTRTARRRAAYRNAHIGFVFQDANLIQGLTAEENLILPLLLRPDSERRQRARAMLARFGLEARAATRVERLSGGERQRVATARALVVEPSLLLVDEPTGNLDGPNAERIVGLLVDYQREAHATMLIATHDERIIERVPRRFHMSAGSLNGGEA